MKKMRRSLGVLTAVVLLLAFVGQASAFCVYNQTTDKYIRVNQVGGCVPLRGFQAALNPGENACCHWTNRDCNMEGRRGSRVMFSVYFYNGGTAHIICQEFPMKAGGYLTVEGSGGNYRCVAHGY